MGLIRDLWTLRKQAKQLRRQAKAMGAPTGFRETLSWGANEAMPQVQELLEQNREESRLIEEGAEGKATIAAFRDTGMTVNENPVVEFDLDLDGGGFASRVTHRQLVSRLSIGKLAVGKSAGQDRPRGLGPARDHVARLTRAEKGTSRPVRPRRERPVVTESTARARSVQAVPLPEKPLVADKPLVGTSSTQGRTRMSIESPANAASISAAFPALIAREMFPYASS